MANRRQKAGRVSRLTALSLPAILTGCMPAIPVPCGGETCRAGQFCRFEEGSCGRDESQGVCTTRAEICTADFSPVCGCDGRTYSNACMASAAGVSVAAPGECEVAAATCGGINGVTCPSGQFCKFEVGACCCDQQGLCEAIPDACAEIFQPVCGCDGLTYSNECEAARAGVTVDRDGACAS